MFKCFAGLVLQEFPFRVPCSGVLCFSVMRALVISVSLGWAGVGFGVCGCLCWGFTAYRAQLS